MLTPYQPTHDVTVLPSQTDFPSYGALPVNAYVLHAREPVLIDTGMHSESDLFIETLQGVIDIARILWVCLTHDDADHAGNLERVLARAPRARLVTCFMGATRLQEQFDLPPERLHLMNPGQTLDIGDRTLSAFRPPIWDSGATMAFVDHGADNIYCSDAFAAFLPRLHRTCDAYRPSELAKGMLLAGSALCPWVHRVDPGIWEASLNELSERECRWLFGTHLPPARYRLQEFVDVYRGLPKAEVFVGPDQAALEAILP